MKSFEIIEMGSVYRRDLFFLVYMTFVSSFFFPSFASVSGQSGHWEKSWKYWQDMVLGNYRHPGVVLPHLKGNTQKRRIYHVIWGYCQTQPISREHQLWKEVSVPKYFKKEGCFCV